MAWEHDLSTTEQVLDDALAAEVDDRRRAELAGLLLADRLRPLLDRGGLLTVGLAGRDPLTGRLAGLGHGWILLVADGAETLVATAHLTWVDGTSHRAVVSPASVVGQHLDLRHALRTLVRDRSPVSLWLVGGDVVDGRLEAVGADHVVLRPGAPGEVRPVGEGQRLVPVAAVVAVRRRAGGPQS